VKLDILILRKCIACRGTGWAVGIPNSLNKSKCLICDGRKSEEVEITIDVAKDSHEEIILALDKLENENGWEIRAYGE
jgi:hypothetical protein